MNTDIEQLFKRYLDKQTSPEENQLVETWLDSVGKDDHAWQHFDRSAKDQWLADLFSDINTSIASGQPVPAIKKQLKPLWYKIAGVAAVLLIALGIYLSRPDHGTAIDNSKLLSISIQQNAQKMLQLPDGTTVWLNASSQLRYADKFEGKNREVFLTGEAYFDVKHDPSKPFIIHTGKVLTTVLGTAFNIREDRDRQTIEVTVTRGKVSVADPEKMLAVLTRNQQLSLNLATGAALKKSLNADAVVAWRKELLQFDDVTLAEAAAQLQKEFNVSISFENDAVKNCRFSGTVLQGEKLEKIMDIITGFNQAKWRKTPAGISIYGKGCDN